MNLTDILLFGKVFNGGSGSSGGASGVVVSNADLANCEKALNAIENLALSFPHAINVESSAFANCSSLKSIDLPSAKMVDMNAFENCVALESVNLPSATFIGTSAFHGCISLKSIDLPSANRIHEVAFNECTNLSALILRSETMCQINLTAIIDTKIATAEGVPTGEGFVYVPSVLYEDYVAHFTEQATALTGDAAVAEYIVRAVLRKIEDYPEICG